MKVLRVFWIHHTDKKLVENSKSGWLEARYKKLKKQSDFHSSVSFQDARESILKEFGEEKPRPSFVPPQYAEIVGHTITEDCHEKDSSIKADKAFQDPLFDPVTWQGLHKERV
jgi:hypothetical protein